MTLPFTYYDHQRPWKNPVYVPPKKRMTIKQIINDEMSLKCDGPVPPGLTPEQIEALPPKPNCNNLFFIDCYSLFLIFTHTGELIIGYVLDMSLQAPPTLKPKKKYCDITGLIVTFLVFFFLLVRIVLTTRG